MSPAVIWWNLLLVSALWGASLPLVRFVVAEMSPVTMTAARGLIAAAVLALYLVVTRASWPGIGGIWRHALLLGLLNGFVPNILNGLAMQRIESLPAALVQATVPLFVAVLAAVLLHEASLTRSRILGLALGLAGVGVILGPAALTGGATLHGIVLMLGVALCYALSTCYMRWAMPPASAPLVICQQLAYAVPGMGLALATVGPSGFVVSGPVWVAVVVLAVFASAIPLTLFVRTLRYATAGQASVVGYLQPVSAAVVGALWLGEVPEWRVLAGGAVVLAGCWVMARR